MSMGVSLMLIGISLAGFGILYSVAALAIIGGALIGCGLVLAFTEDY